MYYFVLLVLATFWAWETLRFTLERFIPQVFDLTRPLHPLLVAALPLAVLWPDWIRALAVAGATGLLVGLVDRVLAGPGGGTPVQVSRRSNGALPPWPR